ncbi:MAG: twin-arginine translocation signal domain-containing protein [Patulibacter minatonensis]
MPSRPTLHAASDPPGRLDRRGFLATAAVVGGALVVAGGLPDEAEAASLVLDGFNGLAAFVVPGFDPYSVRQGVTTKRAGGVDNGAGEVVIKTLDRAIPAVVGETDLSVPGALAYALLLKSYALSVSPLRSIGPFSNAFANLTWQQKREVLIRLDAAPPLENTQITFAGNALITLAGFGAYTEGTAWDASQRRLTSLPVGWTLSKYQGVSNGHADLIGYYGGRTEVEA